MKNRVIPTGLSGFIALFAMAGSLAADDYPIAGTTPWQRPDGAPIVEWVQHNKAWYQKGLTGVSRPYPPSLYFMDNQGNWYTPFTTKGMSHPYDLRGWHQ